MARKKVKASNDDVPTVEEALKTSGTGEPINGHSKKVGQSLDSGGNDGTPLKAKSKSVGLAESDDSQVAKGSVYQQAEAGLAEVKKSVNRDSQDGEAQSGGKAEGQTVGVCSSSAKEVTPVSDQIGTDSVKAPWVNLFKENRNPTKGFSLQFMEDLPEIPEIRREHALDVHTVWGYSLVGYFAGRFPGKAALLKLCDSWHVKYKYSAHSSGWLLFQFDNESSRDSVMAGGPYTVFGRPLMLKAMPPFFEFDDQNVSFLPVWVNLPALPLECWTSAALSIICSKIGKPISTDSITATRGQFSYARVLIEIDASKDLIKSVLFKLPSGKLRTQPVIYEYEPRFCAHCKVFGHSVKGCKALEQDKALNKGTEEDASMGKKTDVSVKASEGNAVEATSLPSGGPVQSVPGAPVDPGPSNQATVNGLSINQGCSDGLDCGTIVEDQSDQRKLGADDPPIKECLEPVILSQESNHASQVQLEAPFVKVIPKKKKRINKQALSEEYQGIEEQGANRRAKQKGVENEEQGANRRAKQKGVEKDAVKGVSNQQIVIKKGASPHESR